MIPVFQKIKSGIEVLLILSLLMMVLLTFADVLGRRLFGTPIYGGHDLTEHLMAVIVFCGLPLLTSARGHLSVDLLDHFLMVPSLRWWHVLINFGVSALLLLVSYQFYIAMLDAIDIQEVSQELLIPRSYMYSFISVSCFISSVMAILPATKATLSREESL